MKNAPILNFINGTVKQGILNKDAQYSNTVS